MQATKVGIREFRDNLAAYLLESDQPVAITRHGDTVGYYLPARRKRTEEDREALQRAASRLQTMLTKEGLTEDRVLEEFQQWRASRQG
jgi:PHD/YefM family antitoxin component YafN of YafNO toxin-antitoxin module